MYAKDVCVFLAPKLYTEKEGTYSAPRRHMKETRTAVAVVANDVVISEGRCDAAGLRFVLVSPVTIVGCADVETGLSLLLIIPGRWLLRSTK